MTPTAAASRTLPAPSTFLSRTVVDALAAAGLLIGRDGSLPDRFSIITDDSRRVIPGGLFVAVRGTARDGHDYLEAAAKAGATAAIVEVPDRTMLPRLVVRGGRLAPAVAAVAAYGDPASALRYSVAVTGTNGKSTTVSILRHLLDSPPRTAASIGTIGVLLGSDGEPAADVGGLTTPGPIDLQRVLRDLVDRGVRSVALEASSHSLDQHRLDGITFDAAVFSNLTRDHLDYHETMDAYFAAKAKLLSYLRPNGAAIVNADDPAWQRLARPAHTVLFSSMGAPATYGPPACDSAHAGANGSWWSRATRHCTRCASR